MLGGGTCVWDQEVHHLGICSRRDHHTTAVGGSADSVVSAELGKHWASPGWWCYGKVPCC